MSTTRLMEWYEQPYYRNFILKLYIIGIKFFFHFFIQYIPSNIKHHDRHWMPSEKIILRTGNREWKVGLSISTGNTRCSTG